MKTQFNIPCLTSSDSECALPCETCTKSQVEYEIKFYSGEIRASLNVLKNIVGIEVPKPRLTDLDLFTTKGVGIAKGFGLIK